MARELHSQRVAVTDATGFLGMPLLASLHAAGAEIVAIVVADKAQERLDTLAFPVERIVVDDVDGLGDAVRRAKAPYLVHLSAHLNTERSLEALEQTVRANLLPTIAVLSAAAETGTRRVVLMGSCEEYSQNSSPFDAGLATDPSSPYGASKAAATDYARLFSNAFGLPTVVLRPSVEYGPGQPPQMLISQVMKALAEGRTIDVTEGQQTRDFLYVQDLVDAIVLSLTAPNVEGRAWNVGSGEVVTVRDCLEQIEQIAGREGLIQYGRRPYREGEIFRYELKVEETYAAFHWRPRVRLEEGLRRTWESMWGAVRAKS